MHFNHKNLIEKNYCDRPFETIEENDEKIIENWNFVVKEKDTVYHLGDFSWGRYKYYRSRLNGKIILIIGNHDRMHKKSQKRNLELLKTIFDEVWQMYLLRHDNMKITLSHYPLLTWNASFHGQPHLHGHCHGKLVHPGKALDVGVDCWNYTPISWDQVKEKIDKKQNYNEQL